MARKICDVCNVHTAYTGTGHGVDLAPRASDMCNYCYTEGGWENTHDDEGHEDGDDCCWICHPELNPTRKGPKAGHTNTTTKTHTSHAGCSHRATPKDRAACRKANTWNGTRWI
jgi:hypothetical protein